MLSGNHFPALRGDKKRQNGIDKTGVYGLRKKQNRLLFIVRLLKRRRFVPKLENHTGLFLLL